MKIIFWGAWRAPLKGDRRSPLPERRFSLSGLDGLCVLCGEKLRSLFSDRVVAVSVIALTVYLGGVWTGARASRVKLSDLSQLRARDISYAVFQECRKNFEKDAPTDAAWSRMSNRCLNVSEEALEEMYRAGVSPVDEVLNAAKELERERSLRAESGERQ